MKQIIEMNKIKTDVSEPGERYGAEKIYLFGSYARGTATPDSDIDLRIDKGLIHGLFQLSGLQQALEEKLGVRVDLITSDCLDESFLSKIAGEEILLYGN